MKVIQMGRKKVAPEEQPPRNDESILFKQMNFTFRDVYVALKKLISGRGAGRTSWRKRLSGISKVVRCSRPVDPSNDWKEAFLIMVLNKFVEGFSVYIGISHIVVGNQLLTRGIRHG